MNNSVTVFNGSKFPSVTLNFTSFYNKFCFKLFYFIIICHHVKMILINSSSFVLMSFHKLSHILAVWNCPLIYYDECTDCALM